MTVGESVSRLRNSVKEVNSDSVLSNRFLWNILYTSSLMLLDQDKNIHNQDVFKVVHLESEEVNIYEGSCVPLDCTTCRYKLPKGAEYKKGLLYRYIATPDMSTQFNLTDPGTYQNRSKIRGAKHINSIFLEEGYLYSKECYPCLKVAYLPGDSLGIDNPDGCSLLDTEAIIPDRLIHRAIGMGLNELNVFIQKPSVVSTNKDANS